MKSILLYKMILLTTSAKFVLTVLA